MAMDGYQPQPFLESERNNTDKSLDKERDKTNRSLMNARSRTELLTDQIVHAERELTDEEISSLRIQADLNREKLRDSHSAQANAAQHKQQLQEERLIVDKATEREREKVDTALDIERQAKNVLIEQFLQQEREQTDQNLSVERYRTDSEVEHAYILLSSEVANHLKTKTSLTTRDEFLAIVSHDLKNPIGAVSSCAEILLDKDYHQALDPETRKWIGLMKRSADASLRLINDLLDMERVAEGRLKLRFAKHDLGLIIRESIESHALLASAKEILLCAKPLIINSDVICDRDRIAQVLANLIGNAIKFTPEKGNITVSALLLKDEVQVSIQDTGPGIPEAQKEQVFERFIQLGLKDRDGLGLGLHISKMLIEAHQGRLWAQSGEGEGSTFCFSLPSSRSV